MVASSPRVRFPDASRDGDQGLRDASPGSGPTPRITSRYLVLLEAALAVDAAGLQHQVDGVALGHVALLALLRRIASSVALRAPALLPALPPTGLLLCH